jgi:hypothetical protein
MNDVAAYHVFVYALFPVQGGMWTGYSHIIHNNEILTILIRDFSEELYVLPDDDMRCAIETCRSSESVLV